MPVPITTIAVDLQKCLPRHWNVVVDSEHDAIVFAAHGLEFCFLRKYIDDHSFDFLKAHAKAMAQMADSLHNKVVRLFGETA